MILSLIISLILTLIIELIISLLVGIRGKRNIIVVICANICTNPVVVYISNIVQLFNNETIYFSIILVLEILVVIVEYFIYKKYLDYNKTSKLLVSLLCNATSFEIGLIMTYVL